jgi:hypothetical protein
MAGETCFGLRHLVICGENLLADSELFLKCHKRMKVHYFNSSLVVRILASVLKFFGENLLLARK